METERPQRPPTFSRLVCGSPQVLAAFSDHAPARAWWSLILRLHGKPAELTLPPEEKARRVADGFRFYAVLYRGLAVLFGLLCPLLLAMGSVGGLEENSGGCYPAGASLLAALYLWFASGLGREGARSYALGHPAGRTSLLAFMVMIVAFLSAFVAAASVAAHSSASLTFAPNLLGCGALLALGVGSYLIEIVYLAGDEAPQVSGTSQARIG